MFKNWKVWLGFVISAVFLYITLKDVQLDLLIESFRKAQWGWLLLGVPVWLVSLAARSQRWAVLMGGAPFWVAFHGTNIGYALNMTLPLRLGEVARAFAVHDRTKIPVAKVLSSVVVERLLDLAVVLGLFAVSAQFIEMPATTQSYVRLAGIGMVGLILIGAVVVWQAQRVEALLANILRKVLPKLNAEPWLQRFRELCAGFAIIGTPARFLSITALHRGVVGRGFGLRLSQHDGVYACAAGSCRVVSGGGQPGWCYPIGPGCAGCARGCSHRHSCAVLFQRDCFDPVACLGLHLVVLAAHRPRHSGHRGCAQYGHFVCQTHAIETSGECALGWLGSRVSSYVLHWSISTQHKTQDARRNTQHNR